MSKATLTRVTLTGADETVEPRILCDLSRIYPFVEWGILIGSQDGKHRFPSSQWIATLLQKRRPEMQLSLHICGKHLRDIAKGEALDFTLNYPHFQRCQLNWHAEPQGEIAHNIVGAFKEMQGTWQPEIIFQLDEANDHLALECSRTSLKVAGLHDMSHGAGKLPESWLPSFHKFPIGYAGGLGPENLAEELPKILEVAQGDIWIDMETKLFDGLQFSFTKCLQVLEFTKNFIGQ